MKTGTKTIIGGVVCLLGAFVVPLLFLLSAVFGSFSESDEHQFKAPGTLETTIEHPGRYYVWNDFQTIYEGKNYSRPESLPDGIEIHIRDENGDLLPFTSNSSISMTSGSNSKRSIGYVEIAHTGKVIIEISGGSDERIFSFAQSGFWKIFGFIFRAFAFAALAGLIGIGLVIWGIVKLARANKQARQPA